MILREGTREGNHRLGRDGETVAEEALLDAGLRILHRRFRCRLGEIDLVARDGHIIVFVEVKARRGLGYGRPAAAVTRRKQARMARVALVYLSRHGLMRSPCRFDVVEVLQEGDGSPSVRHIPDAFRVWPTG